VARPLLNSPAMHRRAAPRLLPLALALAVALLPAIALAEQQSDDMFTRALARGPLLAGLAALAGGFLVSLTPCVYPMIAITVSIFGAREAGSRREAMLLSTSFVGGIVALFTPMLVGAAMTGGIFGAALSNKWVVTTIAVVFIAMAFSMFGAFEMVLPESLMGRLQTVGGIGYGGAFLLGLVSGVVAAPCTGPVLTGILLWIGKTQSIALGAVVGAAFSIGLGIPFWLVGTFAVSLPKSGKWMTWVKSFFGVVLLVVAHNNLKNAWPVLARGARHEVTFFGIMAGLVAVGLLLGAVHLDWGDGGLGVKLRKGAGIAITVVSASLLWAGWEKAPALPEARADTAQPGAENKPLLTWLHSESEAVTKAKAEKKPLIVDFTAEWCKACNQLSRDTFADPRVMEKAGGFVAVKVDATSDEDPQVDAVKNKYGVKGLPTVVIYDSTGKERGRINEFIGPEKFLKMIEGVE